jgi:hypothetical protein
MGKFEGKNEGANEGTNEGRNGRYAPAADEKRSEREARPPGPRMDAAERLTIELARLRAKFGADPAIARASFDEAWMSPTAAMEEDEAEFIDAVADCLGVGLSLDAALTCWDSGGMSSDDGQTDTEDDDGDETPKTSLPAVTAHHAHLTGRRLVIP